MKSRLSPSIIASVALIGALVATIAHSRQSKQTGYILVHEKDVMKNEPGPHDGGGKTTVYNLLTGAEGSSLGFKKRVLHPGSSIGYHLQEVDEVYDIIRGVGELTMNGQPIRVEGGDIIFTKPGSSHGLKPIGEGDLVVVINYATGKK